MKRGFLLITLLSLVLVSSTANVTGSGYGDAPDDGVPILQVLKWSSVAEIELGHNITVYVNITNWSDLPAYNLTITEPIFSNWSTTDFIGYDDYVFTKVDSMASISYEYTVTLLNEGNYTIEPTSIAYVDGNSTSFYAYSSYIPIFVYIEAPVLDMSSLWNNIFWMSALFVAIPVALRIYLKYKN